MVEGNRAIGDWYKSFQYSSLAYAYIGTGKKAKT
jgi:hypothetical protein